MKVKIIRVGTSKGIILNKKILKTLSLQEGDLLKVTLVAGTISLKKEDVLDRAIAAYFENNKD